MREACDVERKMLSDARAFARDVVAPSAMRLDRENSFDPELLREAASLGFTRIQVSTDQGGLGLPFSAKSRLGEILATADFGFAMSVLNTQNIAYKLSNEASPSLAARYVPDLMSGKRLGSTALTEPHAGSDFAKITTHASRDGDGWRVNGEKAWIINAAASDVILLYAQTQPGSGGRGIAAFLIDGTRDGFVRKPPFAMTSQHTIGVGGFELRDVRVEADEMLQAPGEAFKTALHYINGARTYVAAMCCGMVAAALDTAAEYGGQRETFGKRLVDHQGWRWRLGEADVDLAAARRLVDDAAALVDMDEDAQFAAARAKIFATRMAERHLPALAQAMGAEGLREDYIFGRHLIGARIAGFVDGSTEMLLERVTRRFMS